MVPFASGAAHATGALRAPTQAYGRSLADRACLAPAAERRATALTADKAWQNVGDVAEMLIELLSRAAHVGVGIPSPNGFAAELKVLAPQRRT